LLLGVLSFLFIVLPGAINGMWSLFERIQGLNIVMPEISVIWFTWITAPIGFIMLVFILWQVKRSKKADQARLTMLEEQDVLPSQSNGIQVVPEPKPELKPIIHEYDFGFGGGGYPPKRFDADKALWLRLGVTFKVNQNMRIETLYLLLSGDSIQPEGKEPYGYYIYFEMPQQVKSGDVRTIQLVASAKGKKWGSDPMEISILTK